MGGACRGHAAHGTLRRALRALAWAALTALLAATLAAYLTPDALLHLLNANGLCA